MRLERSELRSVADAWPRNAGHPPHEHCAARIDLEPPATSPSKSMRAELGAAPPPLTNRCTSATCLAELTWAVPATLLEFNWGEQLVWQLTGTAIAAPRSLAHRVQVMACLPTIAAGWHFRRAAGGQLDSKHAAPDRGEPLQAPRALLTERQVAVLQALVRGKSNKQIANELRIAEGTVKNHLRAAFQTLGVGSRLQIMARAQELGLVG